jgi:hypothetical protein
MNEITLTTRMLPAMSQDDVNRVRDFEDFMRSLDQVEIQTTHHFHAGLYSRTIRIPAGVVITGVLIKIPTLLILSGHATVYVGGETIELGGYHVLPAFAGRKQVFVAHAETDLTMVFATSATTLEEVEAEFTAEPESLRSRQVSGNTIIRTGE